MTVACIVCVDPHIIDAQLVTALDRPGQTEQAWVQELPWRCKGTMQENFSVHTGAIMEIQALIVSITLMWCCAGCNAAESRTALRSKVVSCLRARLLHVKTGCSSSIVKDIGCMMRTAASRQYAAPDRTLCAAKESDC